MTALLTAAKAPPAFLSKNYANQDCLDAGGVTVSSGDVFKARALDMSRDSWWTSLGSADGVTESYDCILYTAGLRTSQSVDVIILTGINAKNFVLRYQDVTGGGAEVVLTVANYTKSYYIVALANAVGVDHVRYEPTDTQTANQEKTLARLVVAKLQLQPTTGFFPYTPDHVDNIKTVALGDGTRDETVVGYCDAPSSFELWRGQLVFPAVDRTTRDALHALKFVRPLLVMPEPGDDPNDIFLCRLAPNGYQARYVGADKDAGSMVTLDFEEIGA